MRTQIIQQQRIRRRANYTVKELIIDNKY